MLPRCGFIQVDLDPQVFGSAFPQCETLMIQAEIGVFVTMLVQYFEQYPFKKSRVNSVIEPVTKQSTFIPYPAVAPGRINPQVLMSAIQSELIDDNDTVIMSECGNAFIWTTHYLRFLQPGRYRTSTFFGSMGHFCAGVVGGALASQKKVVAVVGDGSFLMQNEVSTAVKYKAPAVWIILNDGGYGICKSSLAILGLSQEGMDFHEVDFVAITRAQGGDGIAVTDEHMLSSAINQAIGACLPFVLDVKVDPHISPPFSNRIESIRSTKC
jgi:acetolactate synthase-1/2/3 large subunit